MHDRALNHTLKTQRGLRVDLGAGWDHGGVISHKFTQVAAQFVYVGHTGFQHLNRRSIIKQRKQQVFNRNKFVAS